MLPYGHETFWSTWLPPRFFVRNHMYSIHPLAVTSVEHPIYIFVRPLLGETLVHSFE